MFFMPVSSNLQLSIILPIYNVAPYVEKCIKSLEDQDLPKDTYEIICVNDGSPDNSQQIVEKLQQEFSNIILINQKNQGVSTARNVGMKRAKGKYILFVDPDDALQENCLCQLINYSQKNKYDVVFSPFTIIEINGDRKIQKYDDGLEKLMEGPKLYFAIRSKNAIDPDRSVAILYKRELLVMNNLTYLENVPYLEDGEFIARVLCLTKRGSIYNEPYYLRLNRPGSATRSDLFYQKISIKGFILAAKNLNEFKKKKNLDPIQIGLINGRIVKFVVLSVHASLKNYKNFKWVKNELRRSNLSTLDLENVDSFYKRLGNRFNRSIDVFFLYSWLNNMNKTLRNRLKFN